MRKLAVKKCLFVTAMMATGFSYSDESANPVSTDTLAAMDGDFYLSNSDIGGMDIPVVLTAARLRQSQLDAPASVTIIEADTIEALGFKDIEEIFRLVPGMLVAYHSGVSEKTASVSYHGTNLPEHRRLQVLIDGRSVFKPGLARVEWADIPLAVEDIDRIEVIRGPNSAAYGANSYLGVINIMTKHPQSEKGVVAKVTGGMREVKNSYVNISDSTGSTEFRWTIGSKQKSGFDVLSDGETENRDGIQANYTTLSTYAPLSSQASMEWHAGYKTGLNEQRELHGELTYYSPEDIYADDIFLQTKVNYEFNQKQSAHVQVYSQKFIRETDFHACLTQDAADALTGGDIICGDFNKDLTETKTEIEYQHTSLWNDRLRTVMGARLRLDEFESETYNGGHTDNLNSSLFINAEYRLSSLFLLNVGGMYEKDDLNGDYFSPRLALNTQFTNTDTVRFIYSEAIRAPDLFEQGGQWVFLARDAYILDGSSLGDVEFPVGTVESNVDFEKIKSTEISYFGMFPTLNAQLDVKIFIDELSGLISESLGKDVELTNSNRLRQKGIEGQFSVSLSANDDIALSFSYLDSNDDFESNKDDSGELTYGAKQESTLTADRSGSLSWIHKYHEKSTIAVAWYHVENWNIYATSPGYNGYEFSRLDLNIVHHMPLSSGNQLTLQGTVQHRLDEDPLGRSKNNYTDDTFAYASVAYRF